MVCKVWGGAHMGMAKWRGSFEFGRALFRFSCDSDVMRILVGTVDAAARGSVDEAPLASR